jgi:protein-S-isoprenylcysteine O-methyltransferase Ste14
MFAGMLWARALIFTALAPCVVGFLVPALLRSGRPLRDGAWALGWIPTQLGGAIYAACFFEFLAAGGTPAAFMLRPLRRLIGEEPGELVRGGLYRFTRNPMYVGVLTAVLGQAVLFSSGSVAIYGLACWLGMHLFVVFVEEPHLRCKQGHAYEDYCRRVPRWIGISR